MEQHEQRIEICKKCEFYAEWFCKKCGCILPVKTRMQNEKCPLGKW